MENPKSHTGRKINPFLLCAAILLLIIAIAQSILIAVLTKDQVKCIYDDSSTDDIVTSYNFPHLIEKRASDDYNNRNRRENGNLYCPPGCSPKSKTRNTRRRNQEQFLHEDSSQVGGVRDEGFEYYYGPAGPQENSFRGGAGAQGSQGVQGSRGAAGLPGSPGQRGAAGRSGLSGMPGSPGSPGSSGVSGAPGNAGLPGPMGAPGFNGAQGSAGLPGQVGAPGFSGAPGNAGWPGPMGEPGISGSPGAQGSAGLPGRNGSPGLQGPNGSRGLQGDSPIRSGSSRGDQSVHYDRENFNYYGSTIITTTPTSSPDVRKKSLAHVLDELTLYNHPKCVNEYDHDDLMKKLKDEGKVSFMIMVDLKSSVYCIVHS